MNKGFTLFISIMVAGTLLLVSTAIINVAVKEAFITSAARESQYAFYAADTGLECALFWDVQNPNGISAFATSTTSNIFCNQDANNSTNPTPQLVGGNNESTFLLTFNPDPYCARVIVRKSFSGGNIVTTIDSYGYNSCDTSNPRRVQRAVRAIY